MNRIPAEKFWGGPFQTLCRRCYDGQEWRLARPATMQAAVRLDTGLIGRLSVIPLTDAAACMADVAKDAGRGSASYPAAGEAFVV